MQGTEWFLQKVPILLPIYIEGEMLLTSTQVSPGFEGGPKLPLVWGENQPLKFPANSFLSPTEKSTSEKGSTNLFIFIRAASETVKMGLNSVMSRPNWSINCKSHFGTQELK